MAQDQERKNEGRADKPDLTPQMLERAFFWARDRVASVAAGTPSPDRAELGELGSMPVLGAFVSFKKRMRLRSCMGYMFDGCAFGDALDSASVSAAKDDPRFPPISVDEFYDLDMEIWALGSLREVREQGQSRRDAVVVGRDGVQIQGRGRRGLLLPSVAIEQGWDVDRFLDGVCDKAGLARGAWKDEDVRLFTFEGVSFKKPFVWQMSQNPSLARIVSEARERVDSSAKRATFSFAPGLFTYRAPASRSSESLLDDARSSVRPSAVAGMFYPKSKSEQARLLEGFDREFRSEGPIEKERRSAALVPHAGWIYSGRLAARTLSAIVPPELVVVFAPKHRREGAELAVMPSGRWELCDGAIDNDLEFVDSFTSALPSFRKDALAHRSEHSIEVQLPLIARYFPNAKVVGVLIGASPREALAENAERFARFLSEREGKGASKPLLLISSDMNHYASDAATRAIDRKALDALDALDPERLFEVVRRERITMCGVLPAYFALKTLQARGELVEAKRMGYATSGDASGDLERVVGYAGYCF